MSKLNSYISKLNEEKKVLSVYLTAGFPNKEGFEDLVLKVYDAGADIIEIGVPFSDPLADGKTIQASSQVAIDNGVNTDYVLSVSERIKERSGKPLVLMTYANPVLNYGIEKFLRDTNTIGIEGLIIPDAPLEERKAFEINPEERPEIILLTTPASPEERIKKIDMESEGFLYCVSVLGTTGAREGFDREILSNIERTYKLISKNKMLVGFGISSPSDIEALSPYCDGMIVGSAVIKSLSRDDGDYSDTLGFIEKLNEATRK